MLFNLTQNSLIAEDALICRSYLSKASGLMFSKRKNLVFVFDNEVKEPLHMFFVFYPIDALFLDKDKKIVEIKRNFKPFRFYSPKNKAQYIIELAKDYQSKFTVGDQLEF
ncbi:DUF192 domain-containing protein [Candidatus Woesearchaeota archaeon]|nr:DUF192 domain-containing protein [Candidatus Woesearchaeota archaeon]